ncbi:MAG: hypothetical protein FWH33_02860 [Oscillospiraceae bacterium]|nr:hypothetical protein [Oscillospiraceae bacterium]
MNSVKLPEYVAYILHRLIDCGYEAYIVGGCVRDAVMGRAAHDWDVATSACPEEVAQLFEKTFMTGEKYGTVTVLHEFAAEVTTFREDGEYLDGRRPENVELISNLEGDLRRRDFTMNAMAASIYGDIIDPYGGLDDIKNRLIRCVGNADMRFKEDALRMFRAYRFSAELGFSIEGDTLNAIHENASIAEMISAERVRVELEKTLLSPRPEIVCDMLASKLVGEKYGLYINNTSVDRKRETARPGLLSETVPPLAQQGAEDGRSLAALLSRLAGLPLLPMLRWCAFCAVLLDQGAVVSCADFLHVLRMDSKTIKSCRTGIELALRAQAERAEASSDESRIKIKRLLAKHGVDAVICAAAALDVLQAGVTPHSRGTAPNIGATPQSRGAAPHIGATSHTDTAPHNNAIPHVRSAAQSNDAAEFKRPQHGISMLQRVDDVISSGECYSLKQLAISGSDLISIGHEPGLKLGERLETILDHVICHPDDNERDILLKIAAL